MNSVWSFKTKFVSVFMSALLAFMMFPFAAFADTGQESSDTTGAVQDQVAPEGEDAVNNQGEAEDNNAVNSQEVPEEGEAVDNQNDMGGVLEDIDDSIETQPVPHVSKSNSVNQSKYLSTLAKQDTGTKDIVTYGRLGNVDWTIYSDGSFVLAPHPGTDGRFGDDYLNNDNDDVTSFRVEGQVYAFGSLQELISSFVNLTSADFTGLDTSEVTNMFCMMGNCENLSSLNLSGFNTSKVTDMSHMFWKDSSLTSLDLSSFNTSEVTDMSYMFFACSDLRSLDLSGFNTSKVTDMSHMFESCFDLRSLDLSGFDTSSLTNSVDMFTGCCYLNEITFGEKFKYNTNMGLHDGRWQKGGIICTSEELANLSPSQLAGTWTCVLDMEPAGSHGYTLWDPDGTQFFDTWYTTPEGKTYYFGEDGYSVRYLQNINGQTYYFNGRDYTMFTGVLTWKKDGRISFFDAKRDGAMSKDRWISWKGKKYYLDENGYSVKYRQNIDGNMYYFNSNGTQYTGILTWKADNRISFFDTKQGGKASKDRWISWKGKKYYLDPDGYSVKYLQTIKGNDYYFNGYCQMQTGVVIWKATGKISYFDPKQNGKMSKNRWISYKGTKYYLDENGYSTKKVR